MEFKENFEIMHLEPCDLWFTHAVSMKFRRIIMTLTINCKIPCSDFMKLHLQYLHWAR